MNCFRGRDKEGIHIKDKQKTNNVLSLKLTQVNIRVWDSAGLQCMDDWYVCCAGQEASGEDPNLILLSVNRFPPTQTKLKFWAGADAGSELQTV